MKVNDLIRLLEGFPQDAEVLTSDDEEGNTITELWNVTYSKFIKHSPVEIDLIHPDDLDQYLPDEYREAIVLW